MNNFLFLYIFKILEKKIIRLCILKNFFLKYNIPVVFGFPFGHIYPILTLPIGVNCMVQTSDDGIIISLLEKPLQNN